MSHTSKHIASRVGDLGLLTYLPKDCDLEMLRQRDSELIRELHKVATQQVFTSPHTGLSFINKSLAAQAKKQYALAELQNLQSTLLREGTLQVPLMKGAAVKVDEVERDIYYVPATVMKQSYHGDMTTLLYLRDHVQVAAGYMELYLQDPENYHAEGEMAKKLLLSSLHLMSTPAQLNRFQRVIARLGRQARQADWPHICLHFDDLQSVHPNNWRNKQDAFQMLAYLTLDALERGFLTVDELATSHKQFLASVVPFLEQVGFPLYENSGSWEEVAANRTSVMAIEVALLAKVQRMTASEAYAFLCGDMAESQFLRLLERMLASGLQELGRRLPYESPEYHVNSMKFREADMSLAYVLMYDLPNILAAARIPIGRQARIMTAEEIEELVLDELATLDDPVTCGMFRYKGDSYQGINFYTSLTQAGIKAIKEKIRRDAEATGDVDLDEKQMLRNLLLPRNRPAAWTHGLGQLSAWASLRSLAAQQTGDMPSATSYQKVATRFLNRMLATITGADQWHAVLNDDGELLLQQVPAFRLPECFITYETDDGDILTVPSPDTPLHWSVATCKLALGLRICAAKNQSVEA